MSCSILIIGGPTASGKTFSALQLAQEWKCPILSADSRQVYIDLNVGTAKPSWEERSKVPHFLIDICTIEQSFTAWDFRKAALNLIQALAPFYDKILVVGGTGLYLHALLHDIAPIPPISQKVKQYVQHLWEKGGLPLLQETLKKEDPLAWEKIDIHNPSRIRRALEVWFETQKSIITYWKEHEKKPFPYPYKAYFLIPEKSLLKEKIAQRTLRMFQQGWIEEVQILRKKYQNLNLLRNTIGYAEILHCLETHQPITETVIQQIIQRTSQYAKRQITWFKKYLPEAQIVTSPEQLLTDALTTFQ